MTIDRKRLAAIDALAKSKHALLMEVSNSRNELVSEKYALETEIRAIKEHLEVSLGAHKSELQQKLKTKSDRLVLVATDLDDLNERYEKLQTEWNSAATLSRACEDFANSHGITLDHSGRVGVSGIDFSVDPSTAIQNLVQSASPSGQ